MDMTPEWAAPIPLEQNTQKWLQDRHYGIGSSDAPVIMEVSPWKTPYELWVEKTSPLKEMESNVAQRRGHELESVARLAYEKKYAVKIPPKNVVHPKYPFLKASLDGWNGHVVEIKCPGKEDHAAALRGEIPKKYYPQLQHQLMVTETETAHYYSFDGKDGVLILVPRNQKYIDELLYKERDFWEMIQTKTPPPFTEQDYIPVENVRTLDLISDWKAAMEKVDKYKEEAELLRVEIERSMTAKRMRGAGVRIQLISRKGNINYSAIPELAGVDLEKYRKAPTEFFQFLKEKELGE